MSRSRKHTPIAGYGKGSCKEYKQHEHRRERRQIKITLEVDLDDEGLPDPKKYGNEWASPRDGKGYFKHVFEYDPDYYESLMRK